MRRTRIAITGLGIFCGAGKNVAGFTGALLAGKTAIGPVDLFDVTPFPARIGAQIRGYDPLDHFDRRQARKLSRADQFAMIAAREALDDSGISGIHGASDLGVVVGAGASGMFQCEQWLRETLKEEKVSPSLLRGLLPDRTATELAREFSFAGYQGTITTACSSSATAIGWGADLVASGMLKAALCGGTDSLSLLTFAGFNSLKVVDPEPCSPFSLGRQGISLGEGAAFLAMEEEGAARQRGARIYGYVLGYAAAGEAYHMTAPEPTGASAARVMRGALSSAGLSRDDIGWVNAHGTGTPLNDAVESRAMHEVFGERALYVPLVSTKALTGHCLGAAGSVEALATVVALNRETIPQTLNFRGRDPECDLDYRHDATLGCAKRAALSNSFAFGGNITTLAIGI